MTAIAGLDITHTTGTTSSWSLNIATSGAGCLSVGQPDTWTGTIPAAAATGTYFQQTAYVHRVFTVGAAGATFTFWVVGLSAGDIVNDAYDYINIYAVFYPS